MNQIITMFILLNLARCMARIVSNPRRRRLHHHRHRHDHSQWHKKLKSRTSHRKRRSKTLQTQRRKYFFFTEFEMAIPYPKLHFIHSHWSTHMPNLSDSEETCNNSEKSSHTFGFMALLPKGKKAFPTFATDEIMEILRENVRMQFVFWKNYSIKFQTKQLACAKGKALKIIHIIVYCFCKVCLIFILAFNVQSRPFVEDFLFC